MRLGHFIECLSRDELHHGATELKTPPAAGDRSQADHMSIFQYEVRSMCPWHPPAPSRTSVFESVDSVDYAAVSNVCATIPKERILRNIGVLISH